MKYLHSPITIKEILTCHAVAVINLRNAVSHTVEFEPIALKIVISEKQLGKFHSLPKQKAKRKVTKFLKKYIFQNLSDLQQFNITPTVKEGVNSDVSDEVLNVKIEGYGLSKVKDVFVSPVTSGDYLLEATIYPFISFDKVYSDAKPVTEATDTLSVIEVEETGAGSPEKEKPAITGNKNKGK